MAKYNDLGIRQCDQDGCKAVATHWLVWTAPTVCCVQHMEKTLHVARMMGHPTPAATLRALMPDEQKMQVIADLLEGNEVRPTTVIVPDDIYKPGDVMERCSLLPIERDVEDYWGE